MKDGGRIVLIGSNTAIRTAFPGGGIYSMTEAALTGLVGGAAIDLAPRVLTVNNVADSYGNVIAPGSQVAVAWGQTTSLVASNAVWDFHNSAIFEPEVIHLRKVDISCSAITAIKRKNPLCLLNPIVLNVSW